jgi:hypothetical protein
MTSVMIFQYKIEKPGGEKKQIAVGDSFATIIKWIIVAAIVLAVLWFGNRELIPLILNALPKF